MKVHNIVLLLAAFGVGLGTGWALHSQQTASKTLTPVADTHNGIGTPSLDVTSTQLTPVANPQTGPDTFVIHASERPLSTNEVDWPISGNGLDFREQLRTLTQVDNANESALIALITSIEENPQKRYQQNWLYRAAIQRWSEINSDAVVRHIQQVQIDSPHGGMEINLEAIAALAITDPEAAWQMALAAQSQGDRGNYIASEIFATLAQSDPHAALDRIIGNGLSDAANQESIDRILMQWSGTDPVSSLNWIAQNPHLIKERYVEENALMQLMHQDPQAGLERLASLSDPNLKTMLETEYASALAGQSPEQAFQWASGLSTAAARSAAQQRVLETWVYQAPEDALTHLDQLGSNEIDAHTKRYLYISAATQKTINDPQGTMEWIATLPVAFQDSTRSATFQNWYSIAPNDAMQWLEYSADYQQKNVMLRSVAPMLPAENLEMALQLYPELDSQTQVEMGYGIIEHLYTQDPERAVQWVDSLPQDSAGQEAQVLLLMMIAVDQPVPALERATALDGELRQMALAQLGMILTSTHPQILDNWASAAPLTDEEFALLTQPEHTMYPGMLPDYRLDYFDLQH